MIKVAFREMATRPTNKHKKHMQLDGCSVFGNTLQYRLKETVLPPCEWRWTVSCYFNSSSLASRGPSADGRGLAL